MPSLSEHPAETAEGARRVRLAAGESKVLQRCGIYVRSGRSRVVTLFR